MTVAKSTKRVLLVMVVAVTVATAFSLASAAIRPEPKYCNHCQLGTPVPDPVTAEFIRKTMAAIYRIWPVATLSNTQFTVCNLTHCASYGIAFDDQLWADQPPQPRRVTEPSRGVILVEPPTLSPPRGGGLSFPGVPSGLSGRSGGWVCVTGPSHTQICGLRPD